MPTATCPSCPPFPHTYMPFPSVWLQVDLRTELYSHIVLSGGSTMFPGLPSRLEHDLRQRYLRDILKGDVKRLSVRACTC